MKRFVACLLLTLGLSTAARADGLPEWSIWKNPRESMLIITTVDSAAGTFAGTFINNAKGYRCAGFGVPIKGKISGNTSPSSPTSRLASTPSPRGRARSATRPSPPAGSSGAPTTMATSRT